MVALHLGFVVPGNPYDRAALRWSAGLLDFAREVAGLGEMAFGAAASATEGAGGEEEVAAAPWQRALLAELKLAGAGAAAGGARPREGLTRRVLARFS
jgi:hypothetical protein